MTRQPTTQMQTSVESKALYYGGLVVFVAALLALYIFWGNLAPLFGGNSVGSVGSVLAALAAFLGFLVSWHAPRPSGQHAHYGWSHRLLTSGALAFCHAAIALMFTIVLFFLAQQAFQGVRLDAWTASVLTGFIAGVCGYAAFLAGTRITSLRLSTTLAVFMIIGTMVSMITAPNPYWWQIHFSSLGGGESASAAAFNLTLLIGGLVAIGLADLIAQEFARWQASRTELAHVKVKLIRLAIAAIGVFLACVGIFAYDTHLMIHNLAAGLMALVFIALTSGLSWVAPGFEPAFYVFSYAMCAGVVVCAWLNLGVGYLNLTTAELIIAGIIFGWIVVFVRQIAAGLADSGIGAQ